MKINCCNFIHNICIETIMRNYSNNGERSPISCTYQNLATLCRWWPILLLFRRVVIRQTNLLVFGASTHHTTMNKTRIRQGSSKKNLFFYMCFCSFYLKLCMRNMCIKMCIQRNHCRKMCALCRFRVYVCVCVHLLFVWMKFGYSVELVL